MGFLVPQKPIWGSMISGLGPFSQWSIRRKLMTTVIPLMALVLAVTGYAAKVVAGKYLGLSLERTTKVFTMGQASALTDHFEQARQDILLLARWPTDPQTLLRFLSLQADVRPGVYREAAFIPADGSAPLFAFDTGREVRLIGKEQAERIINPPHAAPAAAVGLGKDGVALLGLSETIYPPGILPGIAGGGTFHFFRLVTPVYGEDGSLMGFWMLSLDGRAARELLSIHNSPRSPLAAFQRTSEKRYSFFIDGQGWMLFQSGNPDDYEQPLSTDMARSGLRGDHGQPGNRSAFRPSTANEAYWRMVVDVQAARTGVETVNTEMEAHSPSNDTYSLGYSPVYFKNHPDKPAEVVGGVAFMDKSRLLLAAEYRLNDVLLAIFVASMALTTALLYAVARVITSPLLELAARVRSMPDQRVLTPIDLPARDRETSTLKDSINALVEAVLFQREELRLKDAHIHNHILRQPLDLDQQLADVPEEHPMEGVIGRSPAMRELKWLIRKAAAVDPDVLIIGETGTGKEVTAQAIHKLSRRASGPYITINCGALDENLLLDALFGHVKGAFSEAKADRKGAFLAAQGGTILLDEIGNASAKVQQALLRALAERTIIPLGSDQEIPFDARVIAATNVELLECVKEGSFREDLYYRLRVLTLHTPSLRERMEDIPPLVGAFLKESAAVMNKSSMSLSKGAWERIAAHHWPGNVRELKHCIMRAVAMADSNTIFLEDLRFDAKPSAGEWKEPEQQQPPTPARPSRKATPPAPQTQTVELNARQRKGLEFLAAHGSITRSQYQAILDVSVPARTAQYDLRDMVERGLLRIKGKGPATRYVAAGDSGKQD
ncbi:Transcriptional regulatory protein GlrR [Fundidesulfovibrio magnetotacticus]|uniref:Transcriptional regulatory protein GlrR n=1 Tax=Fundidesulfovibrio magnetotacticus TaxID=2730080 RepID=A0A6V8LQU5_9BACT|nr:sigma-54 dependent transcriptional regulator [Fundidesulfovibrio magnetotacticus]GFK94094.1 Transcriptional regulatory protein GlrR [Fundidesulfovibrio magnetotacticus]